MSRAACHWEPILRPWAGDLFPVFRPTARLFINLHRCFDGVDEMRSRDSDSVEAPILVALTWKAAALQQVDHFRCSHCCPGLAELISIVRLALLSAEESRVTLNLYRLMTLLPGPTSHAAPKLSPQVLCHIWSASLCLAIDPDMWNDLASSWKYAVLSRVSLYRSTRVLPPDDHSTY